jgi:hypothetical protein
MEDRFKKWGDTFTAEPDQEVWSKIEVRIPPPRMRKKSFIGLTKQDHNMTLVITVGIVLCILLLLCVAYFGVFQRLK